MNCRFKQDGNSKVCTLCNQPSIISPPDENVYRKCTADVAPPSWFAVAITFSKALYRHARNWFRKAGWLLRRDRFKTCVRCPGGYFMKEGPRKRRCKICWCPVKSKVAWKSEKCPAKFWPEQQEQPKVTP